MNVSAKATKLTDIVLWRESGVKPHSCRKAVITGTRVARRAGR